MNSTKRKSITVERQRNCPPVVNQQNNDNQGGNGGQVVLGSVDAVASPSGNNDAVPDPVENEHNEPNYEAKKARKSSKKQQLNETFQEKIIQAISAPIEPAVVSAPPPPPEKKEYVDLAFAALKSKMKSTLSDNEMMDAVEEVEQVVIRICREKRRRVDYGSGRCFIQLQPLHQQAIAQGSFK